MGHSTRVCGCWLIRSDWGIDRPLGTRRGRSRASSNESLESEGFTPAARAKGLASLAKRKSSIAGKSDDVFSRLLFVRVHRVAPEHQPWRRETRFSGPPFLISGINYYVVHPAPPIWSSREYFNLFWNLLRGLCWLAANRSSAIVPTVPTVPRAGRKTLRG